ncbi:major facilitator superfamily domain-containing protein [Halteromyces radiatus]|uniref:major facilitator superfamily domain-containing protein n=1 Tax=Halteromyces radiatus TaxID=101107 RepID=UPI00221F53F6|nr:major facilitator superfamily domain-containing protein [Halteromyces radiatus]KAI8084734.1 major facilitator superfamily domain-containing protein [Halteromyces radiatus]
MDEKKIEYSFDAQSVSTDHYEHVADIVYDTDPLVEKRLLLKLDCFLMPFVSILYLFASLDRSNIGNARLGSFEKDLHLQGNDFYNALMVFYIGYMICQIPSNLVLKMITPSIWIGMTTIIWGVCSTSISAATSLPGLAIARFFLGCAEAGLGPCVPLLLSFWYQRHEMASRVSVFLAASTLAGSFAGIWAYLIMDNMDQVHGLASWRWMFIIEGIPTIALGILCLIFLPNYPESASKYWLTAEEKQVAIQRGIMEGKNKKDDSINKSQIIGALIDYKTWLVASINSGAILCHASFSIFLPTIVKAMGFQALQAQLLSIPPYITGCIVLLAVSRFSDRICQRGLPIIGCSILSMIGYTFLLIGNSIPLQYTGVILVACGVNPIISLGISWLSNNQQGHTRRGVSLSGANMFAQVFGLIGTQVYRDSDSPNYRLGHAVCLGFTMMTIILACLLRYILARENKRRDELYGPAKQNNTVVADDDDDFTENTSFRYIL